MWKKYKLSELKGILKVGDEVRNVEGEKWFCGELHGVEKITNINLDEDKFWINHRLHFFSEENYLEVKKEKNLYNLEVGDVLHRDGGEYMVLEVLTQSCLLSRRFGFVFSWAYSWAWFTFEELEKRGYTIKQSMAQVSKPIGHYEVLNQPKEMTVAQVSEALGYDVKIIKE